jgi:hypothetical protein
MKRVLIGSIIVLGLLVFAFVAPVKAQKESKADRPSAPSRMPAMIYVTDFEIDTSDVTQDRRLLPRPRVLQQDTGAKAGKLVEMLSSSLTRELQNKSIPAEKLYPGQTVPDKGWLIKGQFLEVGEGNRLRRAMIGFGAGATDMQVEVAVIDLGSGQNEPFMVFGTDSKSGRGPGAIVMMNPYAAAAKFVLSKRASDKDVRKTARGIADVIRKYIEDNGVRPKVMQQTSK